MLTTEMRYVRISVTKTRDRRDSLTDVLQDLVDRASDSPDQRPAIAKLLFGDQPVPDPWDNWEAPTAMARERATVASAAAARAAYASLREKGATTLPLALDTRSRTRRVWRPLRLEEPVPPAPLVCSLAEGRAIRVMATLTTYAFTKHTAHLWDERTKLQQMQRLNAFAQLELILWRHAAAGGHTDPPPYTVRFDLARWLWHPAIAGSIFCLRCGDPLRYSRAERKMPARPDIRRDGRCRRCARERDQRWPDNAIEPHQRGTWLLRCAASGCTELHVGRRQARYCERHRPNRLNSRHRPVRQTGL
jgi:hypothetical protein